MVTEHSDAAQDAEAPPPQDDGRQWFAVHTYSGYENKVKTHLEARVQALGLRDKITRVVVPMEEETEIKNGQRRTVQRKVFPGYVLVEMVMNEETWHTVRNIPGVTSFVGAGTFEAGSPIRPVPLQASEIQSILKQSAKTEVKPKAKISYAIGQHVRVNDGPFTDFIGTVSEIQPDRNKVVVVVTFFGRETPVTLDFLQVEKV